VTSAELRGFCGLRLVTCGKPRQQVLLLVALRRSSLEVRSISLSIVKVVLCDLLPKFTIRPLEKPLMIARPSVSRSLGMQRRAPRRLKRRASNELIENLTKNTRRNLTRQSPADPLSYPVVAHCLYVTKELCDPV
jgi:hypothetical protein